MPPTSFPDEAQIRLGAVTPNRTTRLMLGMPEYRRSRVGWNLVQRGARLSSSAGTQAGRNLNVALLPSDSWCIASWEMQMQFERQECDGNLILGSDVTPIVDLAPGFESFVSQSQIPGVTYDSSVVPLGSYFARKRKSASSDWHAELTDGSVYPKPVQVTENAPMRRAAHQQGTMPRNSPVYLRWLGPAAPLATNDALITFYFGGTVDTNYPPPVGLITGAGGDGSPPGDANPPGGRYCVTLYGSGRAVLFEMLDPAIAWRQVDEWEWEARGKIANQQHVLCVLPEGVSRLNFVGSGRAHYYEITRPKVSYSNKAAMTGAGRLRLDMREDLRSPFQFGSCSFPNGGPAGTGAYATPIYGMPFRIPYRVQAGSKIFPYASLDSYLMPPPGAGLPFLTIALYDAKTFEALSGPAGDGSFTTLHDGQRDYYAVYVLRSDSNHSFTPYLRACEFKVDGAMALATPAPWTGGQIMEVAINGPEAGAMDCDHAMVLVEDDQSLLEDGPSGTPGPGGLGDHADVRAQIQIGYTDPAAGPVDYIPLFDGVVVRAPMERTGRVLTKSAWDMSPPASPVYPSPKWKTIRLQIAGEWYRLSQPWQVLNHHPDFAQDRAAPDPSGYGFLPWRIIDMLHEALKQAGYDDSQMRLLNPDGTTTGGPRLFANGLNGEDYTLMPGKPIADLVQHLCKDYLGCQLIWDPFAQPRPRWLTVYPPVLSGTYSTLYTFRTTSMPAGTSGIEPFAPVHVPSAWPAGTTFVTHYSRWVEPPEGNLFVVTAMPGDMGGLLSGDSSTSQILRQATGYKNQLCAAIGVNWRSTQFDGYPAPDPASLDWIPYGVKPVRRVLGKMEGATIDAANEACRFICRRMMTFGAYGKRYFQWLAPLVLYNDPDTAYSGKPRTLRTYDMVTFNEDGTLRNVMLTSVNPQIGLPEGDLAQWAEYQGFEMPVPLSY